jgi:predicted RNase H-like HicB family nuclease
MSKPTRKTSRGGEFDVVIERDSAGWYVGTVPALRGCHTQARSLDKLMERIQEAIAVCLEAEGAPATRLEFIGVQRVRVA